MKKNQLEVKDNGQDKLPPARTVIYLTLFALTIAMVFRLLPVWLVLAVLVVTLLIMDRHAFVMVDWGLLMTFVCFFIFAGNMSRLDVISRFFSKLLQKNTLLTSVLSCQFISNVPSSILLSRFTDNYPALLVGVNIGGTGTLIASLASLITFREYTSRYPGETGAYILRFSIFNFSFLAILTAVSLLTGIR